MSGTADQGLERALGLVRVFHADTERFAGFASASAEELPPGQHTLLAHSSHMTLAMERFHGGPVGLTVVSRRDTQDGRYAREILLTSQDGRIIQYGIVRIDLGSLAITTQAAIRLESEPLGRILTTAGLLCEVHDVKLLRVAVGPECAALVGSSEGAETFGRVATIGLDGRAIIELLEIVVPGTA